MKRKFQQDKVVEHFETSAEVYSARKGVFDETDLDLINFFKEEKTNPENILEVGGGSGYLLEQLGKEAKNAHLVNCEIAVQAYKQQVTQRLTSSEEMHSISPLNQIRLITLFQRIIPPYCRNHAKNL